MKEVKARADIDDKYKWDLSDIYADDGEWEKEFSLLSDKIKQLSQFSGRLSDEQCLLHCLKLSDELSCIFGELYVYARQRQDEDAGVGKYRAMCDRTDSLGVKLNEASSFIVPELAEKDADWLRSLSEREDFSDYDYFLQGIIRMKAHTLSAPEERILAQTGLFSDVFHDAFNMFDNLDVKFRNVRDENGETVQMSHGNYAVLLTSQDRKVRKAAFASMFNAYKGMLNTITQLYAGNVKKDWFYAKVRNYPDCLTRATDGENVPSCVYCNLIKSVDKNLKYLHDYMGYRAHVMGLPVLHMYDLHVPIAKDYDMTVPYDEACQIVLSALQPLGGEYCSHIREAMENKWIDVYENKGKRSGAYSWGTYRSHPYVLLNYNSTAHDVFTIAHELGHSMHSYYSDKTQPFAKAQYEIFVAEVASTVNEVLLLKYLLGKEQDAAARKYLLSYYLDMFRTTLFRQTMFAEFEVKAHNLAEKGLPLTSENLCDIYYKLNKKYYGKAVRSDKLIACEWARIPHFYRSFYVYKYATGIVSAVSIASGIYSGDEAVKEGYGRFLRAGGSMPPVEILKLAGVDLTTDKPFETAMREFADTLEELKKFD